MHGMVCIICFQLSKPFPVPFIMTYKGVDVQIHILFVLTSTKYAISCPHYVLLAFIDECLVNSTVLILAYIGLTSTDTTIMYNGFEICPRKTKKMH